MNGEIWKPVIGWANDYEVSNKGRIRTTAGRILKPYSKGRYNTILLTRGTRKLNTTVHRLMLIAFTGQAPKGRVAAHRNGKNFDNRLENLYWATYAENMRDRTNHGTAPTGEGHKKHKITEAQAIEIKKRLARGEKPMDIAKDFPFVTSTVVYDIRKGKSWKHLDSYLEPNSPKGIK
jgi:hypothetical protein